MSDCRKNRKTPAALKFGLFCFISFLLILCCLFPVFSIPLHEKQMNRLLFVFVLS